MKKVILMLGCSGSGKSFLATGLRLRYIHEKPNSVSIVSADHYFSPLSFGKAVYGWNPEYLKDAHSMCFRQFESALRAGIGCVIVDNTNLRYDSIEKYAEKAVTEGYAVEIVEPDTSWKYDARECHKRSQHNVPLEKIQEMLASLSKLKLLHHDMFKNPTEYFKNKFLEENVVESYEGNRTYNL